MLNFTCAIRALLVRFFVFVSCLVAFLPNAWAERYIISFKNPSDFNQVHSQYVLMNSSTVQKMFSRPSPVQVTDSLKNLKAVIVSSPDKTLVQALTSGQQVQIEKEIFHPAPKPVHNFRLSKPWAFDWHYAQIKNARHLSNESDLPAVSNPGVQDANDKTTWGVRALKAKEAWADSQKGLGSRVLILDTGVDKNHPSLQGRIEATKDFVFDDNTPYDVADKIGHGTHVSGTIAANESTNGFSGVAPQAQILMGRVCSMDGCSNISVIQGINWGIEQKVDVINMSLGGDYGTSEEKAAIAKAEVAGIPVVAASGNDGKAKVGFPAAYPNVIAVGAVDANLHKADFSQWGPELDVMAPGVEVISTVPSGTGCDSKVQLVSSAAATANEVIPSTCYLGSAYIEGASLPLVYVGEGKPEDFKGLDLSGKIALVENGGYYYPSEKLGFALSANAAGMVVANDVDGLETGAVTEDGTTMAIPIVMVEKTVGQKWKDLLTNGQSLQIKIDTVSTNYAAYSGTSMATPHVTGVVALMKAARKDLSPAQVLSILKETATVTGPNDKNQYGSGLVDAQKAVAKAKELQ